MVLFNPKLKTLYKRDPKTFKVIPGQLTEERFGLIDKWLVTEKMDGTSVIISTGGRSYAYYGRTEKSQFTPAQREFMESVSAQVADNLYKNMFGDVDIYAELIGGNIQGNPHELEGLHLRVFDIRIGDFWLDWTNVKDVAAKAGLETVYEYPGTHTVDSMLMDLDPNHKLHIPLGDKYLEGFVARTDPYLYDNQGNRIMWKLKVSDFA